MTDRELRKLNRRDLLELLLEQTKRREALEKQVAELQQQLSAREIKISKAGSLAECALQLSGIFEAAQNACALYTDNISRLSGSQEQRCKEMEQECRSRCDAMLAEAKMQSQQYRSEAAEKANRLRGDARGGGVAPYTEQPEEQKTKS
jgi:succinyl-CoA synthetase beta subunit